MFNDSRIIHLCPNCGKSHYRVEYQTRTCLAWKPIYKDGVMINSNPNKTKSYCHCINCQADFTFEE